MKFSFHAIPLLEVTGEPLKEPDLHKTLGQAIYRTTQNLDLVEKAMVIHKGKEVDLEKAELAEVERIINDPTAGFFAFAKKALKDYIDSVRDSNRTKVPTDK